MPHSVQPNRAIHPFVPKSAADNWRAPDPLPSGLLPVSGFKPAFLPPTLRPWVEDICENLQCPPDYVAVAVMVALGSLIGRRVGIRPKQETSWTEYPNQWGLLVGRPGVLKSPAMEAALAPLKRLQAKASDEYAQSTASHERALVAAKLRSQAAFDSAKKALAANPSALINEDDLHMPAPEAPVLTRFMVNDATAQAVAELHRQNPNGLLVHRDEMMSLLASLDREENAADRGLYLTGWAGNSAYIVDRIGRGTNLVIPAVCLSLLGSTQPNRLSSYLASAVRGGSGDDGLMQRFGLMVWPDVPHSWRDIDRPPNFEARHEAFAIFDRLAALEPTAVGAQCGDPSETPYLRFAPEALKVFKSWHEHLEARLRSGDQHVAMESHLAKYRKLVPSLALILHLADGRAGAVGLDPLIQAVGWADYLETHAARAYASVTSAQAVAAQALLKKICNGALGTEFAGRDVYRKGWSYLNDPAQAEGALSMLEEYGYLASRLQETRGRPGKIYDVNPLVFPA